MCGIVGVYSINENVRKYEHFIKWPTIPHILGPDN